MIPNNSNKLFRTSQSWESLIYISIVVGEGGGTNQRENWRSKTSKNSKKKKKPNSKWETSKRRQTTEQVN